MQELFNINNLYTIAIVFVSIIQVVLMVKGKTEDATKLEKKKQKLIEKKEKKHLKTEQKFIKEEKELKELKKDENS